GDVHRRALEAGFACGGGVDLGCQRAAAADPDDGVRHDGGHGADGPGVGEGEPDAGAVGAGGHRRGGGVGGRRRVCGGGGFCGGGGGGGVGGGWGWAGSAGRGGGRWFCGGGGDNGGARSPSIYPDAPESSSYDPNVSADQGHAAHEAAQGGGSHAAPGPDALG